jgi:hypothetical protein
MGLISRYQLYGGTITPNLAIASSDSSVRNDGLTGKITFMISEPASPTLRRRDQERNSYSDRQQQARCAEVDGTWTRSPAPPALSTNGIDKPQQQ